MFSDFLSSVNFLAISLPDFTGDDLGTFVGSLYNLAIGLVGLAVFMQFLRAGWKYLTAAGNSGNISQANSMMYKAILGTVLLLSAYLILNIVNPELLKNNFLFPTLDKPRQISPRFDPRCEIEVCREATNEMETKLKSLNIDWATSDVSGMSDDMFTLLGRLSANCGCKSSISYSKNPGGEQFSFNTTDNGEFKAYSFLKENASATSPRDVIIGGDTYQQIDWRLGEARISTIEKCYLPGICDGIDVKTITGFLLN